MKRIIVLNQYFYPDIASTGLYAFDICKELADKCTEITVVASEPCYSRFSRDAPEEEYLSGIKIYRINMGGLKGREKLKERILGYFRYLLGAWKKTNELIKKKSFDLLITFHNPPFIGFVGGLIAAKFKINFLYIPYDLHPDILIKSGWKIPLPLVFFWKLINKFVYKRAKKIIVLSKGMKSNLMKNYDIPDEKISIIPLWGKPELNYLLEINRNNIEKEKIFRSGELILLYAGNMGILHPIEIILDAAKILKEYPIKIIFIGDGIKRKKIMEIIKNEGVMNITLLGYLPEDQFVNILSSCHICLVAIGEGLENLALPSRVFTYMSAGKAIISISKKSSDIAEIISENNCGVNASNSSELVQIIKDLNDNREKIISMSKSSITAYAKYFSKDKIIKEYKNIILNL